MEIRVMKASMRNLREQRSTIKHLAFCAIAITCLLSGTALQAQVDPGPRGGPPGAGGPVPTLNLNETRFWDGGLAKFQIVFSVAGTIPGEPGVGLGPAFNGNRDRK